MSDPKIELQKIKDRNRAMLKEISDKGYSVDTAPFADAWQNQMLTALFEYLLGQDEQLKAQIKFETTVQENFALVLQRIEMAEAEKRKEILTSGIMGTGGGGKHVLRG